MSYSPLRLSPESDSPKRLQLFQYIKHQARLVEKIVLILHPVFTDKKPVYTVRKHSYGFSYRKAAMLAQLTISNFAIVRELEIDFHSGMTASPGKPVQVNPLPLMRWGCASAAERKPTWCAGRKPCRPVRPLLPERYPAAQRWLEENQLEDGRECLLRRVISSDGRSRGFINGTAVPLSQLRELGQLLIQIHGQHAHQQLVKPEHQKALLDGYR
jgi:hypothetical protein